MRQATGDPQELLAFGGRQAALDEQEAPLEQGTDFLLYGFAFACQAASPWLFGRRSAALQLGLGFGQALALCGHGTEHALDQFCDDMEGAQLMGYLPKDFPDGFRIECRAIR